MRRWGAEFGLVAAGWLAGLQAGLLAAKLACRLLQMDGVGVRGRKRGVREARWLASGACCPFCDSSGGEDRQGRGRYQPPRPRRRMSSRSGWSLGRRVPRFVAFLVPTAGARWKPGTERSPPPPRRWLEGLRALWAAGELRSAPYCMLGWLTPRVVPSVCVCLCDA